MFSQNNEEAMILSFFGDRRASFLDIGAWDGRELSNTWQLVLNGWRGLMVEPSPEAFCRLAANTKDFPGIILMNAAVASERTVRKFHWQKEWGGSLDENLAVALPRTPVVDYYLLTVSPGDLLEVGRRESMQFEFVSLDAEWLDREILEVSCELVRGTELLCVEAGGASWSDDKIQVAAAGLGFSRIVGKTQENLLLARENP